MKYLPAQIRVFFRCLVLTVFVSCLFASAGHAQTGTPFVTGLTSAYGVAFDSAGNLYVADLQGQKIVKVTSGGVKSDFVLLSSGPISLAFDGSGNLFVGLESGEIRKVTISGGESSGVTLFATVPGSAQGIVFNVAGDLFVANRMGMEKIYKVTSAGVVSDFVTSGLSEPEGMAFDASGNLYVAKYGVGKIVKVTSAGAVSDFATGFSSTVDVVFDSAGNLLVLDMGTGTVSRITISGGANTGVTTIVSGLSTPCRMAFDSVGALYISEYAGSVKKVTGIVPPTLTKPTLSNLGANQVTLTFQSSATGTGYFTLLPDSETAGTAAQTKVGQKSTGTTAYRHGSLPLTANTDGSYTVSNLSAATHYTVCFTADDGSTLASGVDASVSFTTTASANLTGLDWAPVGAAHFSTSVAGLPDLAFAPDGTPYVAFRDGAHSNRTSVMKYNGSSWVYVGAAGFSAGQPGDLNLAIAPDGTPYLAYQDGGNGSRETVMKYDGSAWIVVGAEGFSADIASFSCLAFAPDGMPHIVYSDKAKSYFVTVMKFNGTNWVAVGTAGFTAGAADFPTLAFARDGAPFVAYSDHATSQKATVMKYNGSAWVGVGAAGFSANTAETPCMAIASDGTPYVAYRDIGHGNNATVMKYDGSAWVPVGAAGFSAAGVSSPSLAIAPNGSPFVAFGNVGNSYKATVMGYVGSTWVTIGTAAVSVGPANYPSLVFSPNGTPYISFSDGGSGSKVTVMKLAVLAPTVSAVSPVTGTTLGGTSVTITGTHFTGTTAVKFGTTNATTFTVNSATQITATAPAHAGGVADITVTTGGGTSATSASDQFTYINAPTSLIVSSNGDSGAGSLREAIATIGNGGKITFDSSLAGQAILLASPLAITHDFTIDGSALVPHVRISGNHVTIVVNVPPGVTASLVNLDLVDGYTNDGSSAGCINNRGVLTLRNCVLTGNDGVVGNILNFLGTLTMQSCTLSGNTGYCGAIYNAGPLVMESCTLSGNTGSVFAGGLVNVNTATLTNCTIAGNQCNGTASDMGGGAILQANGTVTLTHCTIVGNRAAKGATSGLFITGGMLTLNNSIVANNGTVGLENFSVSGGTFTSQGFNISNAWNGQTTSTGDLTGNPLLAALADNGGPTQTCALRAGSPALNAANPVDPTGTDQRGVSRPQEGRRDIGAFEAVVGVAAVDVPSNGIYGAGQFLEFTVHFSSAVTVNTSVGRPRLALTIGGTSVYADYASGSGTTDLVFSYTVQSGDSDLDGIALGSAIDLHGGTILTTSGSSPVGLILSSVGATVSVHVGTPPTLTKPITVVSANQVILYLRSSKAGMGYFTLLTDSETAGTAAQTAAGQNASGTTAYRHGSLPLSAAMDGTYTVTNLSAATHYTLCFTAEDGGALAAVDASVSFTTTAVPNMTALDWTAAGAAGFSAGAVDYTSLAFAPDGMLYIAYADAASNNKATVMRFNGLEWTVVGAAGFSAGPAANTNLVFAPDGTPYVAFGDSANHGATVMKFDGMAWTAVGSAGFTTGTAAHVSLAFAPDGTPYVAYTDQSGIGQARVMKFDGTAWTVVGVAGVSPLSAGFTSLAFAPDGTPYVAYQDVNNGYKASVARYNGAAWEPVGLADFSADSVLYTTLAFAPDGTPYVAYADASDSHKATVMKFNGTAWTVVGTPCFSAGTTDYTSLAIAPDGMPCIAYKDTKNGFGATVMKFNGTAWTVVGTAGFSAGEAAYTSLGFSPDGTPYVAYCDAGSSYKATVMKLGAVVTSVSVPTAGTYGLGLPLHFTVNFSGVVTIAGAPRLSLTIGSTAHDAVYTGGGGTSALTYQYVVQPGDTDTDGIVIGSSLNGGIFSGSPVLVGVGDTTGILIDSTAPAAPIISTVTATKLGGTAEAGCWVFVYDGSTLLSTTTAGSDGKWSLTVTLLDGVHTLTATACDAGANFSPVSSAITPIIDSVAPAAPVFSTTSVTTNNTTPTITGTAEAGSTVKIFDVATLLGTTTTASNGTWSLVLTLAEGHHYLVATASDGSGNVSATSQVITPTIDTVAPATPVLSTTAITTNDTTPTLTGNAEAGSTVKIYDGATLLGSTTAGSDGTWSFTPTLALREGAHAITAKATDAAGNTGAASSGVSLTIDVTAPATPAINNVTATTISGTAEAGSVVKIFDGSTLLGTATTASDGTWSLPVTLADGTHSLTATVTDNSGNAGAGSTVITPTIDTVAPAAPVFTATTISTNDTTPTLSGTAEAGSTISVYDGTTLIGTTTAGSNGTWSFTPTLALSEGAHTITAKATDVAGNASSSSPAVAVTIDVTAPDAAVITNVSATTVSGTAEAGSTVKIYDGSNLVGTTTATGNGTWSLLVTLADGTHNLMASATDGSGNVGAGSSVITPRIDTTAPAAPVISNTSGNTTVKTPTLAGTAETGSTVEIYDGTTLLGTTTAIDGIWTFTLSTPLTDGMHAITAKATDAAGNTSTAAGLVFVVGTAPAIAIAPLAQTVAAGSSADFTVSATGTATLGYQWQKSTDNTTYADVSGETSATYAIVSSAVTQTGYYRVVVTNSFGTATSASALLTVTPVYTAPKPDGSAATVTGGSGTGSQSVTVSTVEDFKTYATATTPYVITVVGTLNIGTVNVTSNKTIQGADGNAALLGNLNLGNGVSNVVIRGLNLTNPGTTIVNGAYTDGGDALTLSGASNVFVTHITFFDCADHAIKIINGSDNITVSWCEFYNSSATLPHRTSVQIGTSTESKPLHVTLHHNGWTTNVDQQMPLSTYGYVHAYNNYFASAGNTSGTVVSDQSQLLSERNVYTGLANPLTKQTVSAALTAGKVRVIDNLYTRCTGTTPDAGTDLVFTPSYSYEMLPTSDVATEVSTLAGNTAGAGSSDAATGTATSAGPTAAVTPGSFFTLTSTASGFTATTYQWRLNNVDIVGATASTYTCSNTQTANVGTYTVAISMASGDTAVSIPLVVALGSVPPSNSGNSGGGSFEGWFCAALGLLGFLRFMRRCNR